MKHLHYGVENDYLLRIVRQENIILPLIASFLVVKVSRHKLPAFMASEVGLDHVVGVRYRDAPIFYFWTWWAVLRQNKWTK